MSLRQEVLKLAHEVPELRKHLLPLIASNKEASTLPSYSQMKKDVKAVTLPKNLTLGILDTAPTMLKALGAKLDKAPKSFIDGLMAELPEDSNEAVEFLENTFDKNQDPLLYLWAKNTLEDHNRHEEAKSMDSLSSSDLDDAAGNYLRTFQKPLLDKFKKEIKAGKWGDKAKKRDLWWD